MNNGRTLLPLHPGEEIMVKDDTRRLVATCLPPYPMWVVVAGDGGPEFTPIVWLAIFERVAEPYHAQGGYVGRGVYTDTKYLTEPRSRGTLSTFAMGPIFKEFEFVDDKKGNGNLLGYAEGEAVAEDWAEDYERCKERLALNEDRKVKRREYARQYKARKKTEVGAAPA